MFFTPVITGVFQRNLGDSKSPLVSRRLLNILAYLDNAVVWMVSILRLISNSSNSFSKLLCTVLRAQIIIGITVTFMFCRPLSTLARSEYFYTYSRLKKFLLYGLPELTNPFKLLFCVGFHTSICWWSFTGVWVITGLSRSSKVFFNYRIWS